MACDESAGDCGTYVGFGEGCHGVDDDDGKFDCDRREW